MTAHASRNGLKRLDADDGRRPPDPPPIDLLFSDFITETVETAYEAREPDLLNRIADIVVERLTSDPLWFVNGRNNVLSIEDCARIYQRHPNTMAGYVRLPEDHPDHLPCVDERPYRILPSDFAKWITRRRNR